MRINITSKKKFNTMIRKIFNNDSLPFITGCSLNSKEIESGDMFFPIKGMKFDGHDFIEEAVNNGASLVLNEKNIKNCSDIPIINVDNVMETIKKLAKAWRIEIDCEIIGITGSNGKTSTKELLNQIISQSKQIMSSEGNYNSTLGLPMSILSISSKDQLGILEIGANKPGEIQELCRIAKPTHGLITNISNAHNKYFGTIDNIAKNKLDLFKSLPDNGFAFINMDNPFLNNIELNCKHITYGFSGKYDFTGQFFNDTIKINSNIIKLPYPSMAIAKNYLAAYSVSTTFGIDNSSIIERIENTPIYPGRGDIIIKHKITFINDTYNSNLASCINGIKALMKIDGIKKILVLGDMHELGEEAKNEHIKLGETINSLSVSAVFALGPYMKFTLDVINSKKILIKHYKSKNRLIKDLRNYYNDGDVVYVKGSRCMKMEEIIYNEVK